MKPEAARRLPPVGSLREIWIPVGGAAFFRLHELGGVLPVQIRLVGDAASLSAGTLALGKAGTGKVQAAALIPRYLRYPIMDRSPKAPG